MRHRGLFSGKRITFLIGVLVGLGIAAALWSGRALLNLQKMHQAHEKPWSVQEVKSHAQPSGISPGLGSTAKELSGNGLAFQRAARLRRGVNLTGWYSDAPDYSPERLRRFMTVENMRTLKNLGFDHVRLCIDPEPLLADPKGEALRPDAMARLDKTVRDLTGEGLNVVLDIQPNDRWKVQLATSDGAAADFVTFWEAFAAHFSSTDPDTVFFELINEPAMTDAHRWQAMQANAVTGIRKVAPQHTLIVTASPYSGIDSLVSTETLRDQNLIYAFHEYDPEFFTQQGAIWGRHELISLRGVPYPATPENIQPALARQSDEHERLLLQRFAWDRWDAGRISAEISAVDEWAQRRNVPLYCGEFGVLKLYADPKARVRWINDVRSALEARHIGWAMWEYDGDFGLMTDRGKEVADRNVLAALGLGK